MARTRRVLLTALWGGGTVEDPMSVLLEGRWSGDLDVPFRDLENFRDSHVLLIPFVFQREKKKKELKHC